MLLLRDKWICLRKWSGWTQEIWISLGNRSFLICLNVIWSWEMNFSQTLLHPDRLQHKRRQREPTCARVWTVELLVKMPNSDWFNAANSIRRIKINSLMQILLTNKLEANLNRIRDQKCKFSRSLLFFRLVPDARPMMIAYDTIFFILFIFTFLHSDSLLFREKLRLLQEVQLCAAAVNYMTQYAKWLNVEVFKFLAAKLLATCADSYC